MVFIANGGGSRIIFQLFLSMCEAYKNKVKAKLFWIILNRFGPHLYELIFQEVGQLQ